MTQFIKNLNRYIKDNKLKQNYIVLMTGWDKSKVSRVLKGKENIKLSEAEYIANQLGKDLQYFLNYEPEIKKESIKHKLSKHDSKLVEQLTEMLRYYDALVNIRL